MPGSLSPQSLQLMFQVWFDQQQDYWDDKHGYDEADLFAAYVEGFADGKDYSG